MRHRSPGWRSRGGARLPAWRPVRRAALLALLLAVHLTSSPARAQGADSLGPGEQLPLILFGDSLLTEEDSPGLPADSAGEEPPPEADGRGAERLTEGRRALEAGDLARARRLFHVASFDPDPAVRSAARVGLGDVDRRRRYRGLEATRQYRLALQADPDNREALYALAQAGFELEETHGYRVAGRALVRLILLDPEYRGAYDLWREKIHDASREELEAVDRLLLSYLPGHPQFGRRWLDLARDRYGLGEPQRSLTALARFLATGPDTLLTDAALLSARCRLALGDSATFEQDYRQALAAAEAGGDFYRLALEAGTIFTPEESARWERLEQAGEMAAFFRQFWLSRDPDPVDPRNERLLEHYQRLQYAETFYCQRNPHSRFQNSRDYSRLVTPMSMFYDTDPDIFWERRSELRLDQRGMFFVRHGPPDRIRREVSWRNPLELWYYGNIRFRFEQYAGAGDFIYVPSLGGRGAGNIAAAMAGSSFRDPLPQLELTGYAADFLGEGGVEEIEFYHWTPVDSLDPAFPPLAALALYDTSWALLGIDQRPALPLALGNASLWLGTGRVSCPGGGKLIYALRLAVEGKRAVERGVIEFDPFSRRGLELSGIVLGTPPPPGVSFRVRRSPELLPRPSLEFGRRETVTVYLELYGLAAGQEDARAWRERVTLRRVEGGGGFLGGIRRLFGGGGRGGASRTLTFERRLEQAEGPAAESFTMDLAELAPGGYELVVEALDLANGNRDSRRIEFGIRE